MGGVLAIDFGTRKCGFASTDALRIARTTYPSFRHEGDLERLLGHLEGLVAERSVSVFLVGLPLAEDGSESAQAKATRPFLERLRARFPTQRVETRDERLTTKEAEARLRELGHTGREIRERRDSWSALVLLEDWLRSS